MVYYIQSGIYIHCCIESSDTIQQNTTGCTVTLTRIRGDNVQLQNNRALPKWPIYDERDFNYILSQQILRNYLVVSLWSGDAIWRHRFGLTLAQAMAWYLMTPSHYLNQYWFTMNKVMWHSSVGIIIPKRIDTSQKNFAAFLKSHLNLPAVNELIRDGCIEYDGEFIWNGIFLKCKRALKCF